MKFGREDTLGQTNVPVYDKGQIVTARNNHPLKTINTTDFLTELALILI